MVEFYFILFLPFKVYENAHEPQKRKDNVLAETYQGILFIYLFSTESVFICLLLCC